jgi:small conductance mechanosensitive channel
MIKNLIMLQDLLPGLTSGGDAAAAGDEMEKVAEGVSALKSLSLQDLLDKLVSSSIDFATHLAIALIVFYIGRFIIRKIYNVVAAVFISRSIDKSLATFVLSLINIVLYFILIVTVIDIIGIETTSFLAIFASAGVAIGMALSGTLQNFAGGVLILLLKPYKIGDYIEVQGYAGTVKEIQIFFTVITTADNKSISIPNGGLSTGSVNNYSREKYRRVDWTVSISYGDDVEAARKAILDMFEADSRVIGTASHVAEIEASDDEQEAEVYEGDSHTRRFGGLFSSHRKAKAAIASRIEAQIKRKVKEEAPDYSPKVFVGELAASSVDLTVRAWTSSGDYWGVFFSYNERFYNELPKHGINFPFPQIDVHMPTVK